MMQQQNASVLCWKCEADTSWAGLVSIQPGVTLVVVIAAGFQLSQLNRDGIGGGVGGAL